MSAMQVILVAGFACASAQVIGSTGMIFVPRENHKHLNGCVLPNSEELMAFNETRSLPEVCHQATCQEDRKITYKRCEAILVPVNCTLTDFNVSLPYPQCCPMMVCGDEDITTLLSQDETSTTTEPTEYELETNINKGDTENTTKLATSTVNLTKPMVSTVDGLKSAPNKSDFKTSVTQKIARTNEAIKEMESLEDSAIIQTFIKKP